MEEEQLEKEIVVTLDLDGTLLAHGNKIIGGQETLDLLSEFDRHGIKIVINTGRLDHDIIAIQKMYDFDVSARVSQNGCVVVDDDSIQAKLMDKKEAALIWQELKKHPEIRTEINTVSNRYWKTLRDPNFPKEYYDSHVIKEHYQPVIEYQPITLFLCVGQKETLEPIRDFVEANCQKVHAVMTSKTSLEIYQKGVSKGRTIKEIYPEAEIYGIGDSENDFSVFENSSVSYMINPDSEVNATHTVASITEALQLIKKEITQQ